jgi:hypothetical protein
MARNAMQYAEQQGKRPEEVLKTIADPQLRTMALQAIDILEGRKSAHGYVPFVDKNREQGSKTVNALQNSDISVVSTDSVQDKKKEEQKEEQKERYISLPVTTGERGDMTSEQSLELTYFPGVTADNGRTDKCAEVEKELTYFPGVSVENGRINEPQWYVSSEKCGFKSMDTGELWRERIRKNLRALCNKEFIFFTDQPEDSDQVQDTRQAPDLNMMQMVNDLLGDNTQ